MEPLSAWCSLDGDQGNADSDHTNPEGGRTNIGDEQDGSDDDQYHRDPDERCHANSFRLKIDIGYTRALPPRRWRGVSADVAMSETGEAERGEAGGDRHERQERQGVDIGRGVLRDVLER
jgi:hypothetical protein